MLDCILVEIDDPLAAQILKFICSNEKQTFNATVFISFSLLLKLLTIIFFLLFGTWHQLDYTDVAMVRSWKTVQFYY